MSEKTILKLYKNGDFETFVPLQKNGGYSFSSNGITVPQIIEYPPANYRNYYIHKTSVPGWIYGEVVNPPGENRDRASDFIDIEGWNYFTVRLRHKNIGSLKPEFRVLFYDADKKYTWVLTEFNAEQSFVDGDLLFTLFIDLTLSNLGEKYIRLSINHYDNPNVSILVSVNKGHNTNTKHYLAFEDMPEWVVDMVHPISISPEGIVIKGSLI